MHTNRTKTIPEDTHVSRTSLSAVADELHGVRIALRERCGLLAGMGKRDNLIDFLIDTAFAPLALLAGSGGFESIEEAVEVIGDDLAAALDAFSSK
jgi:hypothetical protein